MARALRSSGYLLGFLFTLALLATPDVHAQGSGVPAPEATSELFVADSGSGLDVFKLGDFQVTLYTTRYIGEVDAEGYLVDPEGLIEAGVVPEYVPLQIMAGNVSWNDFHQVYFNDEEIGYLERFYQYEYWVTTLYVDVRYVKFPEKGGSGPPAKQAVSEGPIPRANEDKFNGPNDGIVPVESVHHVNFSPFKYTLSSSSIGNEASHTNLHGSQEIFDVTAPCVTEEPGCGAGSNKRSPTLAAVGNASQWLSTTGNRPSVPSYYASEPFSRPAFHTSRTTHMSQETGSTAIRYFRGTIAAGDVLTYPVTIDPGDRLIGILGYDDIPEVILTFIDPDGKRIDPDSANADPTIEYIGGVDPGKYGIATYIISDFTPGSWSVEISGTDLAPGAIAEYFLSVVVDGSPITLELALDKSGGIYPTYLNGTPIIVTATLLDDTTPITGATVTARVVRPDSTEETITLTDDGAGGDAASGDGVYTASYQNTLLAGLYSVEPNAEGTASGTPFMRTEGATEIVVSAGHATLSSTVSDRVIDDNGNGLYDFLEIEVGVNIDQAGAYTIEATVEDAAGNVLWGGSVPDTLLNVGAHTFKMLFDGPGIYTRQQDGPYVVRSLSLMEDFGAYAVVDVIKNAHTTAAYSYTDFERPEIIPLPDHDERAPDDDGNER